MSAHLSNMLNMENMLGLALQNISILSLGHLFGLNLLCCIFVFTATNNCHNSKHEVYTDDCVLSEIDQFIVFPVALFYSVSSCAVLCKRLAKCSLYHQFFRWFSSFLWIDRRKSSLKNCKIVINVIAVNIKKRRKTETQLLRRMTD